MYDELIAKARAGDETAFAALADASVDRLLRVARGILGDAHQAEDATQAALIDMWRHLPDLREPQRFEAWSYRLVVNACYSEIRRNRRWLSSVLDTLTTEPTAADELGAVDDRDQLDRAFDGLSAGHRSVVVLHHYVGLPVAQVAAALGIPEGTVRSRLYHAMSRLRGVLHAPDGPGTAVAMGTRSEEGPR